MDNERKKEILNFIICPIIVGIILFILEPTRYFIVIIFKNIWEKIVGLFKIVLKFLCSNYEINGFLLILLIVFSAIYIIGVFMYVKETLKGKDYKEDVFYELKWRWIWNEERIENLWCYCPKCDCELTYDDSTTKQYGYDSNSRTDFFCDHCKKKVGSVQRKNKDYVVESIKREIMRKVRNNSYKI